MFFFVLVSFKVVRALCNRKNKLKTLIYISCGFDAFTRDFQNLTTKGKWRLEHAEGHVLFPGETLQSHDLDLGVVFPLLTHVYC